MASKIARKGVGKQKFRFHFHDSALFDFPKQASLINKVVLKSKAPKLIPQSQQDLLQTSFENVMKNDACSAKNDNEVKSLFRKIYKPFLDSSNLEAHFRDAAIISQIRNHIYNHLELRGDAKKLLAQLYRDDSASIGVLRSDYLPSIGVMVYHFKNVLYNVGRRSTRLNGTPFSETLIPGQNLTNEEHIASYLKKFEQSDAMDYLIMNSPSQAEAMTTIAFRLGMKVILVTNPFFEKPTSTLTKYFAHYQKIKHSDSVLDISERKSIQTELAQMNQIAVKDLSELRMLMNTIQENPSPKKQRDSKTSFWGQVQQMELGILGELESRSGKYPTIGKFY